MSQAEYATPFPVGLSQKALIKQGEMERQRFLNTATPAQDALNEWGIRTAPKREDSHSKDLSLEITGLNDNQVHGTYFVHPNMAPEWIPFDQATMLGHLRVHFMPKAEVSGGTNGFHVTSINPPETEKFEAHAEAMYFALGFLLPEDALMASMKAGTLMSEGHNPAVLQMRLQTLQDKLKQML